MVAVVVQRAHSPISVKNANLFASSGISWGVLEPRDRAKGGRAARRTGEVLDRSFVRARRREVIDLDVVAVLRRIEADVLLSARRALQ
jgi:hypothetical protein